MMTKSRKCWRSRGLILGVLAAEAYLLPVAAAHAQSLEKVIVDGPDESIEVGLDVPTEVTFEITYSGADVDVVVLDTVPAEWQVLEVNGLAFDDPEGVEGPDFEVFAANRGRGRGLSATKIVWFPDSEGGVLTVTAQTRGRPQGRDQEVVRFAPTSPGLICLNDGAVAFEIDDEGNIVTEFVPNPDFISEEETPDEPEFIEVPVVVAESNQLCLEAVEPDEDENGNDD